MLERGQRNQTVVTALDLLLAIHYMSERGWLQHSAHSIIMPANICAVVNHLVMSMQEGSCAHGSGKTDCPFYMTAHA